MKHLFVRLGAVLSLAAPGAAPISSETGRGSRG